MYTETKEFGFYRFDELPEDLQEKVIEKRRYWNVDDSFWYEHLLEYWKEDLEKMGFEDADIRFSGFWSQGDGASFTARCDNQKVLNTLFLCNEKNIADLKQWRLWFELVENGPYINFDIKRNYSRYVHEFSVEGVVDEDFSGFTNKIYEGLNEKGQKYYTSKFDQKVNWEYLKDMFNEFVRDICREIYSSLEKEYEYFTSDSYLKEWLKESDEEFEVNMETMELI